MRVSVLVALSVLLFCGLASAARISSEDVVQGLLGEAEEHILSMASDEEDDAKVYETIPVPAVPLDTILREERSPTFLELADPSSRGGVPCKTGYGCIWDTGVCCTGGEVCCEYACRNTKPPTCGPTPQQLALILARKKMEKEAHEEIQQEADKKAASESGKKAADELKQKTKQEQAMKAKNALQEEKKKRDDAVAEQNTKAETTKKEEQSKRQEEKEKNQQMENKKKEEQASKVFTIIPENFQPKKENVMAAPSKIPASDERTYMFWIRPSGVHSEWSNVFSKGKNNGERDPAVFLYPNSLRLHIRSGTEQNANDGADPEHPLTLHKWTHVAFAHNKTKLIVWMDGKIVINQAKTAPLSNGGDLYVSNPWHPAALVTLSDLRFMPRVITDKELKDTITARRYQEIKSNELIVAGDNFKPKQNNILAQNGQITKSTAITYMFWIMPMGINAGWSSILHKGSTNEERNIGVWFYPGRTRLHCRSGTRRGWNDGADPEPDLKTYEWTHVAITHKEREFKVYFNGGEVLHADLPQPLVNNGPLYAGDPWYPAAAAIMADVRYVDSVLDHTAIQQAVTEKKYKAYSPKENILIDKSGSKPIQGRVVANGELLGVGLEAYSFMFWVKPQGINGGWSNILHKGEADGQRAPGVWFYPGQTRLHIRSGTQASWNDGLDSPGTLPMNEWTHVAVVHHYSRMEVFLNGQSVLKEFKYQPLGNTGAMRVSNPWYPPADCTIADLRWYHGVVTKHKIDEVLADKHHPA